MNKLFLQEINGLRALAVLLVLMFHIDPQFLSAGFLGVDVFLVISGYLITRNINYDLHLGEFSFKTFYKKRIKRLFPALGTTLLITLIAGYFILTPYFYQNTAVSVVYALFSASNFLFFFEDGYFSAGAELKPLLHTWSLGLEEQFYLIWPFILFVSYKFFRKQILLLVLVLSFVSLILAEYYLSINDQACFYLIPFRIFEFGIGAAAVWAKPFIENRDKNYRAILSLLGVVSIIISAYALDKYTPMPGLYSLIPCLATMIVICSASTMISKFLLENKIADVIGHASYSIYLVHWPLIVYYKLVVLRDLNFADKFVLFLISLVLGILLWRIVEVPFKKVKGTSNRLLLLILGFFVVIGMLASYVVTKEGFVKKSQVIIENKIDLVPQEGPNPIKSDNHPIVVKEEGDVLGQVNLETQKTIQNSLPKEANKIAGPPKNKIKYRYNKETQKNEPITPAIENTTLQDITVNPYSMTRAEMKKNLKKYRHVVKKEQKLLKGKSDKEAVIIGNSHAIDLIYALRNNGYKHNITFLSTPHTCYNYGASAVQPVYTDDCLKAKTRIFSSKKIATADVIFLHDDYKGDHWSDLGDYLEKLRSLTQAPIYVIGPKMVFTRFADVIIGTAKKYDPASINRAAQNFILKSKVKQNAELLKYYNTPNFSDKNIKYIDVIGLDKNVELVSSKTSKLLYFDSNHYTEDGSNEFGQKLKIEHPELFR